VWAHTQIEHYKAEFLRIDFETYEKYASRRRKNYIDSTFWFDIHYLVIAVMILVCLALVANYVWKLHLMKAEKKLIDEGKGVTA